jgi:hypothetical protein
MPVHGKAYTPCGFSKDLGNSCEHAVGQIKWLPSPAEAWTGSHEIFL